MSKVLGIIAAIVGLLVFDLMAAILYVAVVIHCNKYKSSEDNGNEKKEEE